MSRPTVRFASTDITYSPEGTPSPSRSSSTLSSPELSSPLLLDNTPLPSCTPSPPQDTPHQHQHQYHSGATSCTRTAHSYTQAHSCTRAPQNYIRAPELHAHLRVPPANSLPSFHYDLMRDPAHGAFSPAGSVTEDDLCRPAVQPAVAKMAVFVRTAAMCWAFEIRASPCSSSSSSPGGTAPCVTVRDVFFGLYSALREGVTQPQWNALAALGVHHEVSIAFQDRCRKLKEKEGAQAEALAGVKRIDLLGKQHRFVGLVFDEMSGMWELKVEEQP